MKVRVAKTAGFCFGVKRAVELVQKQVELGKNVYTYGPIIHNEEVIEDFASKGVKIVNRQKDWEALEPGTIIIRSHGVSEEEYLKLLYKYREYLERKA